MSRPWRVRLRRSLRPRPWGEYDGMCSMPRCARARPPACVPLADEPGLLERQPHEAVRQGDAMLAPREAVEVADVPAAIAVLIELQNALHLPHRGLPARRLPATPVVQADHAVRFI